jgi:hypothetical protein
MEAKMLIKVNTDNGEVWLNPAEVVTVRSAPVGSGTEVSLKVAGSLQVTMPPDLLAKKINDELPTLSDWRNLFNQ